MSPNPILNILGGGQAMANNPQAGMMNMLKAANDPVAALQMMAMNDPRMRTIADIIQQNGGDPKNAFYAEANKRGVNPDEILQQAQSMMI